MHKGKLLKSISDKGLITVGKQDIGKNRHNHEQHSHDHSLHGGHENLNHSEHKEHGHPNHSEHNHAVHNQHHNHIEYDHGQHTSHNHQNHHEHDHDGGHDKHHGHSIADFKKRFWASLVLTIPISYLSMMIQMLFGYEINFTGDTLLLFLLSTIVFFYGGKPFLLGAWSELKNKAPGMMLLISLAIVTAYVYSTLTAFFIEGSDFFFELATLIVIMLLGHWVEMKSIMGASKALEELIKLMPKEAHKIDASGNIVDVSVEDLQPGDQILVKSGEKIPLDGMIFEGHSTVDESMLTGESVPIEKVTGMEAIGGPINGEGVLKINVNKTGSDTYLSQVIQLVKDAEKTKSKAQGFADTAAKWLFYVAIVAGIITLLYWWTIGDVDFALERMVTVLIIACPHALG